MRTLRDIVAVASITLLPIFLFAFGLLFSLYQVHGSPTRLKSALEASGIYEAFVQDSLLSTQREGNGSESIVPEGLPVEDPAIQAVVHDAIPPEFLQAQTVIFLDAVYAWTRGDVAQLEFTIDLRDAHAQLAEGLAAHADSHLAALPACTTLPDVRGLEPFAAFNLDCVPPGLDRAVVVQQVRDEVTNSVAPEDTVLTANDLATDGKTPEQQLQGLRDAYIKLLSAVYVAGLGSLLLLAGTVLAPVQWRKGLRRVSVALIAVGATSALLAWVAAFIVSRLASSLAADSSNSMQASFAAVLGYLAADVRTWWLGFGVLLVALGVTALVALRATPRPRKSLNTQDDTAPPETTTPPNRP